MIVRIKLGNLKSRRTKLSFSETKRTIQNWQGQGQVARQMLALQFPFFDHSLGKFARGLEIGFETSRKLLRPAGHVFLYSIKLVSVFFVVQDILEDFETGQKSLRIAVVVQFGSIEWVLVFGWDRNRLGSVIPISVILCRHFGYRYMDSWLRAGTVNIAASIFCVGLILCQFRLVFQ